MADGTGTAAYNAYDDNDALQSMTRSFTGGPQSQTMSFVHNPDGSRRAMGTPGNVANPMTAINGGSFSYLYDGMGRLAQLNVPFTVASNGNPINGAAGDYLQHQYQANGWLAQTNGLLMGMAPASSTVTYYNYNPRGFLTSLQNYQQNGSTGGLTNSSTFTGMGYDAVGNRLALSASIPAVGSAPDASRSVSFAYDTAHSVPSQNRDVLTGEASAGSASYSQNYTNNFGYDGAYNPSAFALTGSGFSYPPNIDNQINVAGFSFDGDGNPTTYENYTFSFDPEDRLTSAPALNTGGVFTASYDGDGLRATKTATPIGGSSPVTTYFLYDGDTPVLEETASGSTATITAVNVEAADGIRARYSQTLGSQFYGFTYDPQGSLAGSQYSANGFTAGYATSSFEAYGHRGGQIGNNGSLPSNQPPFEFGGQYGYYTDVETGLLCLTHRYYDPGTGKFINRDPIGYAGGQNLYGFCGGNPVNESDPDGTNFGDYVIGMASAFNPISAAKGLVSLGKYLTSGHANAKVFGKAVLTGLNPADANATDRQSGQRAMGDGLLLLGGYGIFSKLRTLGAAGAIADAAETANSLRGTVTHLDAPQNVKGIETALLDDENPIWQYSEKNERVNFTKVGKNYYIHNGHHRITAAINIFNRTGNSAPLLRLMNEASKGKAYAPPIEEIYKFPYAH